MIEEAYVSFDIAQRLKEKGFNESIETIINRNGQIYHLDENSVSRKQHITIRNSEINIYCDEVSCPTQQMAMRWLREEKGIFIEINQTCDGTYYFTIWQGNKYIGLYDSIEFETYELAVAFGLLHVLTKIEL